MFDDAVEMTCCEAESKALFMENGSVNFIYPPPECQFTQYTPIEISGIINTEHLIFADVSYYIFKPPKA
jgi:hypothetical protein